MSNQAYIEIDQATHTYFVDGVEQLSVTQILKLNGLIDDRWFTEYGRWRGSAVHQACRFFDENDLDRRTLDPAIKPFVAQWKKFREATGFTPTEIEQPHYDSLWNYCGTPDRRGYFVGGSPDKANVLVDLKAYPGRQVPPWVRYQLAGYARLVDPYTVFHRFAVVLDGTDGDPVVEPYDVKEAVEDVNDFLALVRVARLKQQISQGGNHVSEHQYSGRCT